MPHANVNGARLYYEQAGEGSALLILLPLGCVIADLESWVEGLSGDYRVIIADYRGSGRSELTPGPYTVKLLAEDAAALLDSLRIQRAHVVGVSLGGHVAQELALLRPELVAGLVLALTGARSNARTRERLSLWRTLKASGQDELFAREVCLWVFGDRLFENAQDYDEARRRIAESQAVSREGYLALIDAAIGFDALERLRQIESRTLCFAGEDDICFDWRQARELADAIPGARLEMLECAHVLRGESLELFLKRTKTFLARG